MNRSKKKFLRRCQEMCGGCAYRPGTDAYEARLGRPRNPLDVHLREQIEATLAASEPFYCHDYARELPDGHMELIEDRKKLCVGWLEDLRRRHKIGKHRVVVRRCNAEDGA
ncbi:MAG: hypothetical protein ACRD68_00050 [Pyrinomonadaceae bacterium]